MGKITFECFYCNVSLTVDSSLGGITGPCPRCGRSITAPTPVLIDPIPPATVRFTSLTPPQPVITKPLEPTLIKIQDTDFLDQISITPVITTQLVPIITPTSLLRTYNRTKSETSKAPYFITIGIITVILATLYFSSRTSEPVITKNELPSDKPIASKSKIIEPIIVNTPDKEAITSLENTELITENTESSVKTSNAVKVYSMINAYKLAESFLKATSLQQRQPLMCSGLATKELGESILTKPLPKFRLTPRPPTYTSGEQQMGYFFDIQFEKNSYNIPELGMIAVTKKENEAPLVLAEPFIDTMGDTLKKFIREKSPLSQDFKIIIDPRISCSEKDQTIVPNSEKKCAFLIKSHELSSIITTTYADLNSEVKSMFDEPMNDLKWKTPKPVTVTLKWNCTEDTSKPYIEIVKIRSLDWNP
jgi:hypothetical protein